MRSANDLYGTPKEQMGDMIKWLNKASAVGDIFYSSPNVVDNLTKKLIKCYNLPEEKSFGDETKAGIASAIKENIIRLEGEGADSFNLAKVIISRVAGQKCEELFEAALPDNIKERIAAGEDFTPKMEVFEVATDSGDEQKKVPTIMDETKARSHQAACCVLQ